MKAVALSEMIVRGSPKRWMISSSTILQTTLAVGVFDGMEIDYFVRCSPPILRNQIPVLVVGNGPAKPTENVYIRLVRASLLSVL